MALDLHLVLWTTHGLKTAQGNYSTWQHLTGHGFGLTYLSFWELWRNICAESTAVHLFLCSRLPSSLASPTAERDRLPVLHWGRAVAFPTHPGAQSSDAKSWCLTSRGGDFFGIAPGGTEAWKWSFCLLPEPPFLAATSFTSSPGTVLQDVPIPKAARLSHWIK